MDNNTQIAQKLSIIVRTTSVILLQTTQTGPKCQNIRKEKRNHLIKHGDAQVLPKEPSSEQRARCTLAAKIQYRHADPYHTFMKSITCYDLQPTHSSLVVFDGKTKVKAAVHALSQHGHIAAVVTNTDKYQAECVFNMGHCLTAILLVAAGNREVASKTLVEFLKEIGSGNIICSGVQNSVWEAANIISHNKISFVPIFDTIIPKPGTPLYFLTPRMILQETVLKLSDFGDAILLHVRQATLDQKKIGTWNDDVLKIGLNTTIEEAIKLMSERKMSTIPVVNDFKQIVNMLARKDIILEIMSHQGGNFHDMLKEPVKILQSLQSRLVYGRSSYTVFETVAKMMTSDKSSLPIIDEGKRILAVVSCSDILSYIQTAERTPTEDRSSSNSSTSSMPKSAKIIRFSSEPKKLKHKKINPKKSEFLLPYFNVSSFLPVFFFKKFSIPL
nr:hypothetical protein T01B6.3 - Caenorhabditis elegans [Caenorhabditis elegans]